MPSKANIKSGLKRVTAFILYYTGIVFLLQRLFFKNKCIVLVYHRIIRPSDATGYIQDGMYVKPEVFRHHMDYLKAHFNIISEQELLNSLRTRQRFKYACHITFDDGWADNYQYAFPLLAENQVPATIFLSTGFIGTSEWFWPDKAIYYIENIDHGLIAKIKDVKVRHLAKMYFNSKNSGGIYLNKIIEYLKQCPEQTFYDNMKNLTWVARRSVGNCRQLLNWDEIRKMSQHSITFGSHTVHHKILTNTADMNNVRSELKYSRESIERHISSKVAGFCFPNGNYSEDLINEVKQSGYELAYIGGRGINDHTSNPLRLKRIGIHNDISFNNPLFACRLLFPFF